MSRFGAITLAIWLGPAALAQVPTSDLATPPATAHISHLSTAGPHGESWMWSAGWHSDEPREPQPARPGLRD